MEEELLRINLKQQNNEEDSGAKGPNARRGTMRQESDSLIKLPHRMLNDRSQSDVYHAK